MSLSCFPTKKQASKLLDQLGQPRPGFWLETAYKFMCWLRSKKTLTLFAGFLADYFILG